MPYELHRAITLLLMHQVRRRTNHDTDTDTACPVDY